MTMIQNIGLFGFNLLIGWANDASGASVQDPGGYALGMWIFSTLGFLGFLFAWLLRRQETGPDAHGLETITVKSTREEEARRLATEPATDASPGAREPETP
jgi:hypothetical protein